ETLYRSRAPHYDASNGGWHAALGRDFVQWTAPAPGSAVLDLACGTGLVTIPMAEAVGSDGIVVGVDATAAMLDVARGKEMPERAARVEFVEADICDRGEISGIETVRRVVERRGGFDVIACCSALVLLHDLASVVRGWVGLLREGGRLIVDVPTEERTVQYLFTSALHAELGMAVSYDRDWVKGMESLERVLEEAGLVVERSWKTKSY
ncbi:S-adenosyl-L-methionine-dependent methyltransferase, partial [Usnea florida]